MLDVLIKWSFQSQLEACAHPFFDDLRDPNACLPNGQALPPLFNFTAQGKTKFILIFNPLTELFLLVLNQDHLQNLLVHRLNCAIASYLNMHKIKSTWIWPPEYCCFLAKPTPEDYPSTVDYHHCHWRPAFNTDNQRAWAQTWVRKQLWLANEARLTTNVNTLSFMQVFFSSFGNVCENLHLLDEYWLPGCLYTIQYEFCRSRKNETSGPHSIFFFSALLFWYVL